MNPPRRNGGPPEPLREVAHTCEDFGYRRQYSVFLCRLIGVRDWPSAFRTRIRPAAMIIAGLFALSLGLAFLFLDRGVVLSWRFWFEIASCMYFLAGALIVLWTVRRSLLALRDLCMSAGNFRQRCGFCCARRCR